MFCTKYMGNYPLGDFSDYCDRILQRVYHSDPGNPPGTVIPWKTFHEYFSDTYIYKTLFLE